MLCSTGYASLHASLQVISDETLEYIHTHTICSIIACDITHQSLAPDNAGPSSWTYRPTSDLKIIHKNNLYISEDSH